jgi:hypothetical protein
MRHSLSAALRRAATLLVLAAAVGPAGCAEGLGPSSDEYTLRTVNDQPLPAAYPDPFMPAGQFLVTAGAIVLEDDGLLSGSFTLRCGSGLPETSTCVVDDPEQEFTGSYSREEGWMQLGERRYPAEFENGRVSVRILIPSYLGYYPQYDLRFTR